MEWPKTRVFWAPNGTRLSARCHFTGLKKLSISRAHPTPSCPSNGCCPHQKHYAGAVFNHRCIKLPMYLFLIWRGDLMILIGANSLLCPLEGNLEFFGSKRHLLRLLPFQGPKYCSLDFQGPPFPTHCPSNGFAHNEY
jgi:hypothetical protein